MFRRVRRWERKHIPKLRHNLVYKGLKMLLLAIPAVLIKTVKSLGNSPYKAKLKLIKDGWANYTFPNAKVERLAVGRAKICAGCVYIEQSPLARVVTSESDSMKKVHGMRCGVCKCPLSAKVRSEHDSCPKGHW